MKSTLKTICFPLLLSFTALASILYIYEDAAKLPLTLAAVLVLDFGFFFVYEKLRLFNKKFVTFIVIAAVEFLTLYVATRLIGRGYGVFREFNAWFFRTEEEATYRPMFITAIALLFTAFISAAVYYFSVVRYNAFYLMLTCMVTFALYAKTFTEIPFLFPSLIIALFLFISIENRWYKIGAHKALSYGRFVAVGSVFVAIAAYAAGFFPPAEETPYREKFDEFITGQNIAAIMVNVGDTDYQLDSDMSGGRSDGGDDEKVLFRVKSDAPFYLKRQTFNNWNGQAWEYYDRYPTVEFAGPDIPESGAKTVELTVVTEAEMVFVPVPPNSVNIAKIGGGSKLKLQKTIRDDYCFSDGYRKRTGQTYSLTYRQDYVPDPNFALLFDDYMNSCLALDDYPKRDKVRELALSLTEGYDNDFEKAAALERYFYNGEFAYDLEFNPKSKAVDYFLFDSKRGTCSDFATAMTVMAREAGLPARYIEGYSVSELSDDGYYWVKQKQAHAFPEIYIEGRGWTIFEPTIPADESGKRGYSAVLAALIASGVLAAAIIVFALFGLPRLKERAFRRKTLKSPLEYQVCAVYERIYAVFMKKKRLSQRLLSSRDLDRLAYAEYGFDLSRLTQNYDRLVYGGLVPEDCDYCGIYVGFCEAVKATEKAEKLARKRAKKNQGGTSNQNVLPLPTSLITP